MEPHNYQNHILTTPTPTPTPTTPTPSITNNAPQKNNKALLISTIICAILAIGGVSFALLQPTPSISAALW